MGKKILFDHDNYTPKALAKLALWNALMDTEIIIDDLLAKKPSQCAKGVNEPSHGFKMNKKQYAKLEKEVRKLRKRILKNHKLDPRN